MSDVDTSAETVERLAQIWERSSWAGGGFTHTRAAATLRTLLAERDAAWSAVRKAEWQAMMRRPRRSTRMWGVVTARGKVVNVARTKEEAALGFHYELEARGSSLARVVVTVEEAKRDG